MALVLFLLWMEDSPRLGSLSSNWLALVVTWLVAGVSWGSLTWFSSEWLFRRRLREQASGEGRDAG
ncbi:MAG TPA: hypothetical protein VEG27_13755 [Usitatibacter sp.]|nr:hypothetical protein [Usitatibacter sp.]